MSILTSAHQTSEAANAAVLATGITAGTRVLTLDGELPVQYLAVGDRVITRSGSKVLKDIQVAVLRDVPRVRVTASALGHDRPEDDVFVAPGQAILVRDWRAKAVFGREVAMVEAQRLVDGDYIRHETVTELRLFTLTFERDEVIYAGGLELACPTVTVTA